MAENKDGRKQTLYFPQPTLDRLRRISEETDRSMSWLVQRALESAWENLEGLQKIKTSPPESAPNPGPKRDALFGFPR